jgi:hypothetical protein
MKKMDTYPCAAIAGAPPRCVRERIGKFLEVGILAGLVIVAGCSSKSPGADPTERTSTSEPRLQAEAETKLLARVDLSKTHAVEFYRFKDDHIGMREIGQVDDADERIDFEPLAGKSAVEIFRTLSKDPQKAIPQALEEAVAVKHPSPQPTDPPPIDPPKEPPTPSTGDRVPALGARTPIGGSGSGLQPTALGQTKKAAAWGDAAWWTYQFCQTHDVDSVWCLPDYAWASTGARWTMYYEANGMNLGSTSVATYWIDEWWGYWQRIVTEDLYPGQWVSWVFEKNTYMYSAISGNDPDWHIHFSERFRNAAPDMSQTTVWPDNDAHYWTEELQGVTQDGSSWYIANRTNLMSFPMTSDLHYYPSRNVPNPWSYWWAHMGAPAYGWNNGKVVVPLEVDGGNGGHASRPAFGIFDGYLNALSVQYTPTPPLNAGIPDEQSGNGGNPWIAFNPQDQRYYSSGYDPTWIYVYDIWYSPYNVTFSRAFQIRDDWGNPIQLHRAGGGSFSPTGRLYLSLDDTSNSDWARVVVIDVHNGRVHKTHWIERHLTWPLPEEIEGVTFWNSNGTAPGGIDGQLHVALIDVTNGQDDWYFKHYTFNGAP